MTELNHHPAKPTPGTRPPRVVRRGSGGPPGYTAAPDRNERLLFAISLVGAAVWVIFIVTWLLLSSLLGGVVLLMVRVAVSTLLAAVVLKIAWELH